MAPANPAQANSRAKKNSLASTWAVCVLAAATMATQTKLHAEPIGSIEAFALAENREAFLSTLIPGSGEHYYFHIVHFQNSGQLAASARMIEQWLGDRDASEFRDQLTALRDRQFLLAYEDTPEATIRHLKSRLSVNLSHSAPRRKGQQRFPNRLDPNMVSPQSLIRDAIQNHSDLKPYGRWWAAQQWLDNNQQRGPMDLQAILQQVTTPLTPRLEALVIADMLARRRDPRRVVRFGDMPAHRMLTLSQLKALAQRIPELTHDPAYVDAILLRLRPDADSDWRSQPDVWHSYLKRVDAYAQSLSSAHVSLQVSARFHLLESYLDRGDPQRDLFLQYLALPRNGRHIAPRLRSQRQPSANLGEDLRRQALLPPVRDDSVMIRSHLDRFLRDATDPDAYVPFLDRNYLQEVFAETKLLHGIGNPETWYAQLSPQRRQSLRDAVEVNLCRENPRHHPVDEDRVHLLVDLKNVSELRVRAYEIHLPSYFRDNTKPVDTSIALEGLVPTQESKLAFDRDAVRRHRERIPVPGIEGKGTRGTWVVDLIGGGLRARALIRRGSIETVQQQTADGIRLTMIDEDRRAIPDATALIGGRELRANERGEITLAPVKDATQRDVLVSDGVLARRIRLDHPSEDYQLELAAHASVPMLVSGRDAEWVVRPRLLLNSQPIALEILQEAKVILSGVDLDNITTRQVIEIEDPTDMQSWVIPFRVPARLQSLQLEVSGKVRRLVDGVNQSLSASRLIPIASWRLNDTPSMNLLSHDGDNYVVEIRGRSGEPIRDAVVRVTLENRISTHAKTIALQTDAKGLLQLGKLEHITSLTVAVDGGQETTHAIHPRTYRWPERLHSPARVAIHLPLPQAASSRADEFLLAAMRDGQPVTDVSEQIDVAGGHLTIGGLPGGDYRLWNLRDGSVTEINVVDGPVIDHVTVGTTRHRQLSQGVWQKEPQKTRQPVSIAGITKNQAGDLVCQLSGDFASAQVHIIGRRFAGPQDPLEDLLLAPQNLRGRGLMQAISAYVSNNRLGDEVRYVLRRQAAKKYQGVMLPQPSVLLNPWETEATDNEQAIAKGGDAMKAMGAPAPAAPMTDQMARSQRSVVGLIPDYDFQVDPGAAQYAIVPDEKGRVVIAADAIAGLNIIDILAIDPISAVRARVTQRWTEPKTVDRRLRRSLPENEAWTLQHSAEVESEATANRQQAVISREQAIETVGDLFDYFRRVVADERLEPFEILTRWHTLTSSQKQAAYGRLACHELHLFLAIHDPTFFDNVIAGYLQNKKEKQLIDDFLLGNDLSEYLSLWRYTTLSAAEQALLAIGVNAENASIRRQLSNVVEAIKPDPRLRRRLIESALAQSGLERSAGARVELMAEAEVTMGMMEMSMPMDMSEGGMGGGADLFFDDFAAGARPEAAKRRSFAAPSRVGQPARRGRVLFGGRTNTDGLGFFAQLDSTKQWAESHFDHMRVTTSPIDHIQSLIPANAFWLSRLPRQPSSDRLAYLRELRVSADVLECVQSRHAALIALALSGLPLERTVDQEENDHDTLKASRIVVSKRLKRLQPNSKEITRLLIGQMVEPLDAPGTQPDLFRTQTTYRSRILLSNPTEKDQEVDVFWQIPSGSIPLSGGRVADSRRLVVKPYGIQKVDFQFYFPATGSFTLYPATVSQNDAQDQTPLLLAQAPSMRLTISDEPVPLDEKSWTSLVENGTADQIRAFLETANLAEIDWDLAAHRMSERDVFDVIAGTIQTHRIRAPTLLAYGLKHRDDATIASFLSVQSDWVRSLGPALNSPLLTIHPIERHYVEHLEYSPLVRARIHRLGEKHEILNRRFMQQYRQFLRGLAFQARIADDDALAISYYLLIQNRIGESMRWFDRVPRNEVTSKLQHDYLNAYLALHRGDVNTARRIAMANKDHPVPRWRTRFTTVLNHTDQMRQLNAPERLVTKNPEMALEVDDADLQQMDRDRRQGNAGAAQADVRIRLDGEVLRIDHRNTAEFELRFYAVDLELLFSKAPFAQGDLRSLAMLVPTLRETIEPTRSVGTTVYPLSESQQRRAWIVEAVARQSRSTTLAVGGDLTTFVSEAFGQLQVLTPETSLPVTGAYVKVYAKYPDGSVRFFKDGYTDGRGRFDYVSISAAEAQGAERFAILVLDEERGVTLHDVAAPTS